jgi:ribosomal protein S27AE
MDKYGVVLDDEQVKTASKDRTCPKCGTVLPGDGPGDVSPPRYCPNCGTEPFEKRPPKK